MLPHCSFKPLDADSVPEPLLEERNWPHTATTIFANRERTPVTLRPNHCESGRWFLEATNRSCAPQGAKHPILRAFARKNAEHTAVSTPGSTSTMLGLGMAALRRLDLSLHSSLLVLHVALLVIYSHRLEQRIIMAYSENSKLPAALSVSLQAFYTLFTAALVALTQRLGLLRTLHREQKLTTLADASSAWSGIGSAIIGLWSNIHLHTGSFHSVIITLYLASTTALHIVSSSIMSFQPYNQTATTSLPTWIAWSGPSAMINNPPNWMTISEVMVDESFLKGFPTLRKGINGTTVYDTLQSSLVAGTARVNSTTFGFNCSLIPDVSWTPEALEWNGISQPSGNVPWFDQVFFDADMSGTMAMMFYGNIDVVYRISTALVSESLQSINDTFGVSMIYPNSSMTVQVFFTACSILTNHTIVEVDAQTNTLLSILPPPASNSSWEGWSINPNETLAQALTNYNLNDPDYSPLWLSSALMDTPLQSQMNGFSSSVESQYDTPAQLSILDEYLMQKMGILVEDGNGTSPVLGAAFSLNLTEFESALATMVAEMFWTAGQVTQNGYEPETGVAETLYFQLVWRLNINLTPLLFAFCASLIILVLAAFLVGWRDDTNPIINDVGILEILWLAEHEPALQSRFGDVAKPTRENLRAAGMFYLQLSDDIGEHCEAEALME